MDADKNEREDNSEIPKAVWVGILVIALGIETIARTPLYFIVCSLIYFIFSRRSILDRIYSDQKRKIQAEIDQYDALIGDQKARLAHADEDAKAYATEYVREHPPISPESITAEELPDKYKLAYYSDSNLPRNDAHISADDFKEFK